MKTLVLIFLIIFLGLNLKAQDFIPLDSLPSDFPKPTILVKDSPAPGNILYGVSGKGFGTYIAMMDTSGNIKKYKKTPSNISNLAVQSNGLIIYNQAIKNYFKAYSEAKIYIADTSLNTIDSIISGNGFVPGPHSSMILPNGHYLYTSFEPYNIDMSKVVKGGNPNAVVAGAVLVEMDINKKVVFQWRAWDYIPVEDTYQPINDFLNVTTLYSNFNSVDVDFDGDYILSNRLLSEITKINSKTGAIIWRLGGKNNQFTILNDKAEKSPFYFSMQHDIRFHSNGNISIFDNGDQHDIKQSRGVEYIIDETNKTATWAWDYQPSTLIFTSSAGSVQKLDNGNTLIGWGNNTSTLKRDFTEVNSNGKTQFEVGLPAGVYTFKALKFPEIIGSPIAKVTKNELVSGNTYKFDLANKITNTKMVFSEMEGFMYNSATIAKYNNAPKYPKFSTTAPYVFPYKYELSTTQIDSFKAELRINISNMEWIKYPEKIVVMQRDTIGNGYFRQLKTNYNSATNELSVIIDKEGEFILARSENLPLLAAPFLVYPTNKYKFNKNNEIKLNWSPKGYFNSSNIEIAEDKDFKNIKYQFNDTNIVSLKLTNLIQDKQYYWRVSCNNATGKGAWSDVREFIISNPYIEVISPNGGEELKKDSSIQYIHWNHNLLTKVKIELFKNGVKQLLISDSLMSYTGAFGWIIPSTIVADSNYKIRITNLLDNSVIDESNETFTILNNFSGIDDLIQSNLTEIRVFPNPANENANFEIKSSKGGRLQIKVIDLLGNEISTIFDNQISSGFQTVNWKPQNLSNGLYYFSAQLDSERIYGRLLISK